MRPASSEKMGYYAAAPEALAELAKHLLPAGPDVHVLDPCAGEGHAIQQLADELGVAEGQVYCIELDHGRGDAIRTLMPKANVLAPCSFFSTAMLAGSFGLVFANPPFDHRLGGGGREEIDFARDCYRLLAPGGVLVLVAPWATFRLADMAVHLDGHYKEVALYAFPDEHRPYHECAFVGVKRNVPISGEAVHKSGYFNADTRIGGYGGTIWSEAHLARLGKPQIVWEKGYAKDVEADLRMWRVPQSRTPGRFAKAGYTDDELIDVLAGSKLNGLIMGVHVPPMRQPPLPLECGHVALLLAAGALDGLVETPGDNHVVRGISTKVEEYNEEASDCTISADGQTARLKEVYTEQVYLKARAVDASGTIYTFTAAGADAACERVVLEHEVPYETWEKIQKLRRMTVANGCTEEEESTARQLLRKLLDRLEREKQPRRTGTEG